VAAAFSRVAVVHSFYSSRQPSGENGAVLAFVEALRQSAFEVALFEAHTDEEEQRQGAYRLRAGLRVATGVGKQPLSAIRDFGPDIVYVHNLFPNFSRKWVRNLEVPLVAVLHNYRPLCVNGLLFRDGGVCTLCPDGDRWAGVRHACYRGSRAASLPLAWANRHGPSADPLLAAADRVVVLSPLQRDVYVGAGLAADKLRVIPNFLPDALDPGPSADDLPRGEWLFVGRLSQEKGVVELVRHWPSNHRLRIIGTGPLEQDVREVARGKPIVVAGSMTREAVVEALSKAQGLVFPSQWFEGFPLVYVEALACGTPVAAIGPSVVAQLTEAEETGVRLGWEELGSGLDDIEDRSASLNRHCRQTFQRVYSEAAFARNIAALHSDLVTRGPQGRGPDAGAGL
jgi:glycosyltransferase involved in cell wall biosynthesis